jgi:Tfp pilus assembly protein PilN
MIKINLALRKSAQLLDAGPGTSLTRMAQGGLGKLSPADLLRTPGFLAFGMMVAGIFLSQSLVTSYTADEVAKLDADLTRIKEQAANMTKKLADTKKFQDQKKELEANKAEVDRKLEAIRKLSLERDVPVRILTQLSSSIPREVWLSELKVDRQDILFKGDAVDFSQVSEFMKNLATIELFDGVRLQNTQQGRDEFGLDIAKFEIGVKRRAATSGGASG